jgi:hypothetical protein
LKILVGETEIIARVCPLVDAGSGKAMSRGMLLVITAFFVVYTATVLLTGHPEFLIPAAILAAIALTFALANRALTKRALDRHDGDHGAVAADSTDNVPSPAGFPDDSRPVGDTPEAHDEINPHDIPKWDAETRQAAEAQAGSEDEETRGNVEGGAGGRFATGDDDTAERTGETQRSAEQAKP